MTCHFDLTSFAKKKTGEIRSIIIAMAIAFVFMILEVVFGVIAHSLALISDALHMFTDVGAFLMSLVALALARRPITHRMTYGSARAEVLGALASSLTLWALCLILVYEAILRIYHPRDVSGGIVFIIATIGLVANIVMMRILHGHSHDSINIRAAYLHVLGDLLGSIGVITSGLLIYFTGIDLFDPIITIIFAIIILFTSGKIILHTLTILMEGTPAHIDFNAVKKDLTSLPSVSSVRDLHIWSISPKQIALSTHLIATDPKKAKMAAEKLLQKTYDISHTTIQIDK